MLAIVRTTNSIVKFDSSASSRIVHRLENFTGYGPSKKPNAVKKKKKQNKTKQKDPYGIRSAGMLLIAGTANGERRTWDGERESGNQCTAANRLRIQNGGQNKRKGSKKQFG